MRSYLLLIALFSFTGIFGQTKNIYGKVTKSDGSKIKGTSTFKGYEDQLIITNYTGGSDNTATIEIEVPTSAYIADFRNMMNAAPAAAVVAKPAATTAIIPANTAPAATSAKIIALRPLPAARIARMDISVTNRTNNSMPTLTNQIILEDVKVESCTDLPAGGTSKIKLKASRIGWIYYSTDVKTGRTSATNRSGWDTVAGASWTNF
jgi:filamentous hemagglutinin family protein